MEWTKHPLVVQLWNFETLSAKLTGLSDGLSPNCFTLSNPTQIATFEAIPLSGINCQLLANGIQIHFHSASNSFLPKGLLLVDKEMWNIQIENVYSQAKPHIFIQIIIFSFQNASSTAHFRASHGEVS